MKLDRNSKNIFPLRTNKADTFTRFHLKEQRSQLSSTRWRLLDFEFLDFYVSVRGKRTTELDKLTAQDELVYIRWKTEIRTRNPGTSIADG